MKPWHFDIGQNGPDWYMDITVDETNDTLKKLIRNTGLPGFRLYEAVNKQGQIKPEIGCYDWYVNESNFTDFVNNIESTNKKNIWVFHTIEVEGNFLRIIRGYGLNNSTEDASEMRMLRTIFDANVEITGWRIFAGGQGYQCIDIAQGKNRQELSKYLLKEPLNKS